LRNIGVLGSSSEYCNRRWSARCALPIDRHTEVCFTFVRSHRANPSRSHVDLQSIEPWTVAAALDSRLHLRPLNGHGVFPIHGRPDRVYSRDCSSLGLTPPTGINRRGRSSLLLDDAVQSARGHPPLRFLAPSALSAWRIDFPESVPIGRHRWEPVPSASGACHPKVTRSHRDDP
jgi:hypothetical protein